MTAGVDEAGRGPIAGPVIAAAVILGPEPIPQLRDSKQLSALKRDRIAEQIRREAVAWSIGRAEVEEIDQLNILQATLLAMFRAVAALSKVPEAVFVDGNQVPAGVDNALAVVRGDQTVPAISAASIIAKVTRDREMHELHAEYPVYGFDRHKGYPTAVHLQALDQYGPSPCHRTSFAPVRRCMQGRN